MSNKKTTKEIPSKVSKIRRRIILNEIFNVKLNYPFEIYRLAVEFQLTGFIKSIDNNSFEIEIEGDTIFAESFLNKLTAHFKESSAHISINQMDEILNYNEFRIINHKI
ncbi:MAG TPA: acylphosphatase [Bacteroidales bacterium]|nr:acylphosphatase [Bacteroidales bacterium]